MVAGSYRFVPRPNTVKHGHPFLVFDGESRLHLPLTIFGGKAATRKAIRTVRIYLYHLLPFFTYLDVRASQQESTPFSWESDPSVIRALMEAYLIEQLGCKVDYHDQGFLLVHPTDQTHTGVHITLASLKLFYKVMRTEHLYPYENPFIDQKMIVRRELEQYQHGSVYPSPMPPESGVAPPRRKRLTDNYFKLVGERWMPQIIDDAHFRQYVFSGAQQLKQWRLRDECVTRLLFETGARVSEVVGLSLGGWNDGHLLQQAKTFNKGSYGKLTKILRFTADTAKLLRRYFDTERRRLDPLHMTLDMYLRPHQAHGIDLYGVPIFLSQRGTPYSSKTYREHAWNSACQAAGLRAHIHQTRHWYVTMSIRNIYRLYPHSSQVHLAIQKLIAYMEWKNGEETMAAYEHYVKGLDHADTNEGFLETLETSLQQTQRNIMERQVSGEQSTALPLQSSPMGNDMYWGYGPADDEFAYLVGRPSTR